MYKQIEGSSSCLPSRSQPSIFNYKILKMELKKDSVALKS